jgi:hypothetical protein
MSIAPAQVWMSADTGQFTEVLAEAARQAGLDF